MELFTFVRSDPLQLLSHSLDHPYDSNPACPNCRVRVAVGGAEERVELHLIANPDQDQKEARQLLMQRFATFDAAKAQCFFARDRDRLLAVIEASSLATSTTSTASCASSLQSACQILAPGAALILT